MLFGFHNQTEDPVNRTDSTSGSFGGPVFAASSVFKDVQHIVHTHLKTVPRNARTGIAPANNTIQVFKSLSVLHNPRQTSSDAFKNLCCCRTLNRRLFVSLPGGPDFALSGIS